jgi:signal transduction histidine kinase
MDALRRLYERLTLPWQVMLTGSVAAALVLATSQAFLPATAFAGESQAWLLAALVASLALAAWPARRAAQGHAALTHAARAIAQAVASDELHLPYLHSSEELHHTTLALRRMVDLAREQRRALEAVNAKLGAQLRTRTQELSTLQDLSEGLTRHTEMGALVGEALKALEQTMDYSSASIWARNELDPLQPVVLMGYRSQASELAGTDVASLTGLRLSRANLQRYEQIETEGRAIVENRPHQSLLGWLWAMVTDDARTSALYRSTRAWMAVPLKVRDGVLGVLRVDHQEQDFFDPERERLLGAVGSQTALAMRHAHLLEMQRDIAVAAERNRIARDLHDAVSQTLFAANLLAGTLSRDEALSDAARGQVQTLERLNRSALAEMRMMLFELRPDALESVRLPELLQHAVEALTGRGGVEVTTDIAPEPAPPAQQRVEIYRIAQEALSNIGRHSGASHVHVGWTVSGGQHGRLHIVDDGSGFDTNAEHPGHFGLENMRERARTLGASFSLASAPGEGTELILEVNWN